MTTNSDDTNVANNVAQPKVQDLTEQWKKGELEQGWYYVLLFSNEEYITFIDGNWVVDDRLIGADIKEVLAPVPTFDEHQQLHKFLEEFNALEVAKENQQLKEYIKYLKNIIKDCEPHIENVYIALDMEKFANGDFLHKSNELLSKIRTAIGEK